jgi:hypothetical protein
VPQPGLSLFKNISVLHLALRFNKNIFFEQQTNQFPFVTIKNIEKNPQHAFLRRGSKAVGRMS